MTEEKKSRGGAALSGGGKAKSSKSSKSAKKKKKRPHRVAVERAEGGYISEHSFPPGEDEGGGLPSRFVLPDMSALHGHMDEHMGPEEQAAMAAAGMGGSGAGGTGSVPGTGDVPSAAPPVIPPRRRPSLLAG